VVLFALEKVEDYQKMKWGKADENVVRFQCGSADFGAWAYNSQACTSYLPQKYGIGRSGEICYQVVSPDDQKEGKSAPPPGTPVTVQIVPVDRETVEFFVEPPKEEKRERKKKGSGDDGAPPKPPLEELTPGAPPAIPTPGQTVD
jgi:hypothetical protein